MPLQMAPEDKYCQVLIYNLLDPPSVISRIFHGKMVVSTCIIDLIDGAREGAHWVDRVCRAIVDLF